MPEPPYVVGIVVDPSFGDQLPEILGRMPVWIAATDPNHRAAERARAVRAGVAFTEPGGLTTFRVDPDGTPEDWFADVLDDVAGHHDRYSHAPGYCAVEAVGVAATPRLLALLASYGLTLMTARPDGFIAATPDGRRPRRQTTMRLLRRDGHSPYLWLQPNVRWSWRAVC